jgi:hypothetical protein
VNAGDCQALIDEYIAWLRKGLSGAKLDGGCEITTPFLDRHNDHLQIYAQPHNGKVVLSDDGYTITDLAQTGMDFTTPKRKQMLETALKGFGVRLSGKRLEVDATARHVGQKMHALLQAMISVNDMFVMTQQRVASLFFEDVKAFLDLHDVRYIDRVKLSGATGFDHLLDFVIPRSADKPERLLQTINVPTRNTITSYLFALTDTVSERAAETKAFAFLNDEDSSVSATTEDALSAYGVGPLYWTRREESLAVLSG